MPTEAELIAKLKDPSHLKRYDAAEYLIRANTSTEPLLEALAAAASDPEKDVADAARKALRAVPHKQLLAELGKTFDGKAIKAIDLTATKRCQYCGEEILAIAEVCKHCGRDLVPTTENADKRAGIGALWVGVILGVAAVAASSSTNVRGLILNFVVTSTCWGVLAFFLLRAYFNRNVK